MREQVFLVATILAVSLGLHYAFLKHEEKDHAIERKKEHLGRFLNDVVNRAAEGKPPLDRVGDLDIRINVMVPYVRWPFGVFTPAYDRPADKPPNKKAMLLMFACSNNAKGRSSTWMPWHCGQGCVGQLWESGSHVKIAVLPANADRSTYNMTENQLEHTSDTRCIVSVAITDGLGDALWRKGILNIASSGEHAEETWTTEGHVADDVAHYLVELARIIVDRGLLPD